MTDHANARKREPIVFPKHLSQARNGHSAPARRKAWPEEKYSVRLPSAYLEDPHTHRFKRVKATLDHTNATSTPTESNTQPEAANRKIASSKERPQFAGSKPPPLSAKRVKVAIDQSTAKKRKLARELPAQGGAHQQGVEQDMAKSRGPTGHRIVSVQHTRGSFLIEPSTVEESGLDLDEKLSLSLDALAKLNKNGAKEKQGLNKKH